MAKTRASKATFNRQKKRYANSKGKSARSMQLKQQWSTMNFETYRMMKGGNIAARNLARCTPLAANSTGWRVQPDGYCWDDKKTPLGKRMDKSYKSLQYRVSKGKGPKGFINAVLNAVLPAAPLPPGIPIHVALPPPPDQPRTTIPVATMKRPGPAPQTRKPPVRVAPVVRPILPNSEALHPVYSDAGRYIRKPKSFNEFFEMTKGNFEL